MNKISALLFSLMFTLAPTVWALPCDIAEKLRHPSIMENDKFWQDYAKFAHDDEKIRNLVNEHFHDASPTHSSSPSSRPLVGSQAPFSTSKQALKDLAIAPTHIRAKYDEFLKYAQNGQKGLTELNKTGAWNFKRLAPSTLNRYSVRLSKDYRVLMNIDKDGAISILNVDIHSAH